MSDQLIKAMASNEQIAARNYWKHRVQGFVPAAYLEAWGMNGMAKQVPGNCIVPISQRVKDALQAMSSSSKATQVILLSAVAAFLQKLSGQPEVLVFTPLYNPNKNPQAIPVRMGFDDKQDFRHFITAVKESILNDFSYGHFPVQKIREMLPGIEGLVHHTGMVVEGVQERTAFEQWHPGLLFVFSTKDGLKMELQYDSSHFEEPYISYTGQLFVHFLDKLLRNRETPLSQLPLVDENDLKSVVNLLLEKQSQQVLGDFNQTAVPYPADGNIISLFEAQVKKTPGHKAVQFGDLTLTYKELDDLSGQFAAYLKNIKKVNHGDLIGVMLEREEYMIPVIYGILKAGCAYIPVDPHFPAGRIQDILDDSGMQWMITRGKHISGGIDFTGWIDLDNALAEIRQQEKGREEIGGNDLAYIIYTSGSTGKPKGVMIEHHSIVNRLLWMQKMYPVGETDVLLQKTPVVFDVSVWELFWWSFTGASLYLLPPGGEKEPALIAETIEKHGITTIHFVPSMLGMFLGMMENDFNFDQLSTLRYVFTSGEALQPAHAEVFGKTIHHHCMTRLINLYGPTEATVDVSCYECDFTQPVPASIPIGKPIDNIHLYIIDKWGCPVPVGVAGELCIAGVGLARGYINNIKLTAEKFVNASALHGKRIYKTGDLAKWSPDGNIIFLGRIDNQVKLRGLRIELGEIEHRMLSYEGIKDCTVLLKEKHGEQYLAAYYVSSKVIAAELLQSFLAVSLPEYMIPAFFVHLNALPLSVNGKLDRKALPDPPVTGDSAYEAPVTQTEKRLAEIWSKVLHLDLSQISVSRSFFDMGGHSLKAMGLINRIRKELGSEVAVKDIFRHTDIRSLARVVEQKKAIDKHTIVKAGKKEHYILSAAQRRMYFIHQFDKDSLAYNMPNAIRLQGKISVTKMEEALAKLVLSHEVLRTVFDTVDEKPVQISREEMTVKLEIIHAGQDEVKQLMKQFIRPFDLQTGPLARFTLIDLGEEEYIFLADMHHIICDGVSLELMMNDYVALYKGEDLPPAGLQYKDYAEWQQSPQQQARLQGQKEYWVQQFADGIPVVDLPTDYRRPAIKDNAGNAITFSLTKDETTAIRQLATAEGSTMFMVLLAAWHILLSRLSGQADIVTGTPYAGRQYADLEQVTGMFINTMVLRSKPAADRRFKEYLQDLTGSVLESFEHQAYQYEDLVNDLNVQRDPARNPLFDAMFNFQNFEKTDISVPGLRYLPCANEHIVAKFDLLLMAIEREGQLDFELEYATSLFNAATINRFIQYYKRILAAVLQGETGTIGKINILHNEEQKLLTKDFNNTAAAYPANSNVITLFEAQLAKTPGKKAIQFENYILTYKELDELSGQFASYFKNIKQATHGDLIGVMLEREEYLVPAIYGVLKAGCAYVPIDPNFPPERIQSIIDDSGMKMIVTRSKHISQEIQFNGWVDLEIVMETIQQQEKISEPINDNDLAYVIYTSGSTGKPKGVMIDHRSVTCRLWWIQRMYPAGDLDVFMQKTPIVFDVSVWELFWWSFTGGNLYLLPPGHEKEPALIMEAIEKQGITTIQFVPSMLGVFLGTLHDDFSLTKLKSLRVVFASGEALQPVHVQVFDKTLWQWNQTRLINMYGPTEATIIVSHYECDLKLPAPAIIPIGKPSDNVHLYILDESGQPVPVGVTGELYIGGEGLARGYINNEQLTNEKFIEGVGIINERVYKTGDFAKWLPDGNVVFLGRMDNQVKLRGQRIELNEIGYWLSAYEGISDCIVVMKERRGEQYLAAYYTANSFIAAEKLKAFLQQHLPVYMIPAFFVHLEKISLSVNGKLDRKSLPDPQEETTTVFEAPVTATEKLLVEIWGEVLKIEPSQISVDRSFFEIGGHSLLAMTVVNKILRIWQVTVSLKYFFNQGTVRSLANYIDMQAWLGENEEQSATHKTEVVI